MHNAYDTHFVLIRLLIFNIIGLLAWFPDRRARIVSRTWSFERIYITFCNKYQLSTIQFSNFSCNLFYFTSIYKWFFNVYINVVFIHLALSKFFFKKACFPYEFLTEPNFLFCYLCYYFVITFAHIYVFSSLELVQNFFHTIYGFSKKYISIIYILWGLSEYNSTAGWMNLWQSSERASNNQGLWVY